MKLRFPIVVLALSLAAAGSLGACGSDSSNATCGNGTVEGSEQCDTSVPMGQTCGSLTMGTKPGGVPVCNPMTCQLDTTMCTSGTGGAAGSTSNPGTGGVVAAAGGTTTAAGGQIGTGGGPVGSGGTTTSSGGTTGSGGSSGSAGASSGGSAGASGSAGAAGGGASGAAGSAGASGASGSSGAAGAGGGGGAAGSGGSSN